MTDLQFSACEMRFHPKPLDTKQNTVSQSGIMEHVRIDEGLQRGARIMPAPPVRRISAVPADNSKLADLDPKQVIARYFHDETTQQIAESLGVHRSALHQWLIRNCEQDWRDAQVARAITALDNAKDGLEAAQDALSLARAREQLRGAQWELERLFSRLYGQPKAEININSDGPVTVQIVEFSTIAPHQLPQNAQITGNSDDKPI